MSLEKKQFFSLYFLSLLASLFCFYVFAQRKLERELALYGGALPVENPSGTGSGPEERATDLEEDDGLEPNASVSGIFIHFQFVN